MTELAIIWELKRLSDCLEKLKSGKRAERGWSPQCLSHPSSDENVWGVLKTTSVQMGEFQPEYNKELPDSLTPKSGLEVNSGDFLVTTTGPRNRCGIVCHVKKTRKKLIFSGKMVRFRVDESLILPNWLMYLLMSPEYQSILDKMKVGTSDSSVSIGNQQILDLEIPVPPIDEQHKIVEILEDHLSRLDTVIADVKQAKLKTAQFRRSLLQAAFTGNLGTDGTSSETELPRGWSLVTLNEAMAECKNGLTYRNNPELAGFPVSRIETISKGELDFEKVGYGGVSLDGNQKHLLNPGDILFSHINSMLHVGKVAIYKSGMPALLHGMNLLRITPNDDFMPEYLFYLFQSSDVRKQIWSKAKHAVNQASINIGELKTVVIPKPPFEEQQKIVALLEDYLSRLDLTISLADAMEKHSNGFRRSLLQAAFTGQLTKEVVSV